ncbi:MAG TPA: sulfite exporter TauE/SafE family protein [Burkholderiales bacterium]|nr:sulfite exporter TauE/SafE family protein [Burkholderiales bacterium]
MLALAALVVAFAYTAFGLTGFGSTVIALPLLAHFFALKFAVPLLMLLDLTAFLAFGSGVRRQARYREIGWLLPFILAGMAAGLTLLIEADERVLLAALGLFLIAYALYGLSRRGSPPPLSRAWGAPIGLAGGAFSALFGTGGVLFALYNAGRIADKRALRATNAAMVMLSSLLRVILFGATGLLTQAGLAATALALAPAMLAGAWIGTRLHASVPAAAVVKAVYALLVIAGLTLLARSL